MRTPGNKFEHLPFLKSDLNMEFVILLTVQHVIPLPIIIPIWKIHIGWLLGKETLVHQNGVTSGGREGPAHPYCCSVTNLCPTPCDPIDYSMPGFPDFHYLQKFAQTRVHHEGSSVLILLTHPQRWVKMGEFQLASGTLSPWSKCFKHVGQLEAVFISAVTSGHRPSSSCSGGLGRSSCCTIPGSPGS